MHSIEIYQHLVSLVVIVLTIALLFLIWRWPGGKHMTFSQHAAQNKLAIIFYFLLFTLLLPPLLLFFVNWFIPTYQPPFLFEVSIIVAILFQYSAATIPEVGGWKTRYHVVASGISGAGMIAALGALLFTSTISGFSKGAILASSIVMTVIMFVGIKTKIKHAQLLILQASFYAAFFVAILVATYFG